MQYKIKLSSTEVTLDIKDSTSHYKFGKFYCRSLLSAKDKDAYEYKFYIWKKYVLLKEAGIKKKTFYFKLIQKNHLTLQTRSLRKN